MTFKPGSSNDYKFAIFANLRSVDEDGLPVKYIDTTIPSRTNGDESAPVPLHLCVPPCYEPPLVPHSDLFDAFRSGSADSQSPGNWSKKGREELVPSHTSPYLCYNTCLLPLDAKFCRCNNKWYGR